MRRFLITSTLTVMLVSSTLFGGNLNAFDVNNTAVAAAATTKSITKCTPKISVKSTTATTANLNIKKVSGADSYKIYRATSPNGSYKCIGTTKTNCYKDTGLKTNKKYYYKVKACDKVKGKTLASKSSRAAKAIPCKNSIKTKVVYAGCNNADINALIKDALNGKITTKTITKAKVKTSTPAKAKTTKIKKTNKKTTKTKTTTPAKTTTKTKTRTPAKTTDKTKTTTPAKTTDKTKTTTPAETTDKTKTTAPASQKYDSSFASQVLKLVNEERAKGGVSALTMSDQLTAPANKRAQEIVKQFSHTRPNGTQWSTVLDEFNVSVRTAGENLAYGYNTPEAVVEGWMNSPGHRANIMNSNFNKIGIGVYKDGNGTVYCTQLFSN